MDLESSLISKWRKKNAAGTVVLAAILLGGSGNLGWWAAWVYVSIMAATQVALYFLLLRKRPELFLERSKVQPGTKPWDKVLVPLIGAVFPMAMWVTAALDERFGWRRLPAQWQPAGFVLIPAGTLFVMWAMSVNPFFSGTVRIQSERGHRAIDAGPYGYLRHPAYAGAIVFTLATPFALRSRSALVPSVLCVAVTVLRTALEDRTLRSELAGYGDYARRVRSRLVPGVW